MEEKRIIELITRKLANEASADELQELENLLLHYPDAMHIQEVFGAIWNTKADEEDVDISYNKHREKYRVQLDEWNTAAVHESTNRMFAKPYQLAGMVCIALIVALTAMHLLRPAQKAVAATAYISFIAGKGVRKSVSLPDGTKVWLNADSKISFSGNMNQDTERVVELSGEAYFDVVHMQNRPFIIHTHTISVKVLGTVFNVKDYPGGNTCETTLIRGSIELSANNGSPQKFILKPSEKFSFTGSKSQAAPGKKTDRVNDSTTILIEHIATVTVADKQYVPETSWTQNKLIFENETLEELAPDLERWYNVKISIVGKDPAGYKFTGAFADETITQALMAMSLVQPFNYTVNDQHVTIY